MSEEKPPDWLPDGWVMEVRRGKKGFTYRYYTCPVSDYTFCTKEEVMCYLMHDNPYSSETTEYTEDNYLQLLSKVRDSLDWLPRGWIVETRMGRCSSEAGKKYKCYVDQYTGSIFYSKEDVLQCLGTGNGCSHASDVRRCCESDSIDNVLAQIEYSPDGLPRGWIKYTKFRISKNERRSCKTRKDPYFIDPVSGLVFRTMKDASCFTEYGVVSKHAYKLTIKSTCEMFDLRPESPHLGSAKELMSQGAIANTCLFAEQTPKPEVVEETEELLVKREFPCLVKASSPRQAVFSACSEDAACPSSKPGIKHKKRGRKKKRTNALEQKYLEKLKPAETFKRKANKIGENLLELTTIDLYEPIKNYRKKVERSNQDFLKQESSSEKSSGHSNQMLPNLSEFDSTDKGLTEKSYKNLTTMAIKESEPHKKMNCLEQEKRKFLVSEVNGCKIGCELLSIKGKASRAKKGIPAAQRMKSSETDIADVPRASNPSPRR